MKKITESSILEMARGAIMEQTDMEVGKIIQNILDPNTDPKKKRTLTLTVTFTPSGDRSTVTIDANAKSKLEPNNAIRTSLFVGANPNTGEFIATEMIPNPPGQLDFNGEEQEEPKTIKFAAGGN